MLKKIMAMTAAVLLALGMMIPTFASATETMYVYTENGKGLNIRWEPNTNSEILTSAPYGSKITVNYHLGNGWTAIYWGGDDVFYVQTRFLSYQKPGKKPSPQPTAKPVPTDSSSTIAGINRIFKTYRPVGAPYRITVRPTRASGWVNLRFAPTKEAELMATYKDGEQLTVIAEFTDWYQVEDPDTGAVGYMSSKFVTR